MEVTETLEKKESLKKLIKDCKDLKTKIKPNESEIYS